MKQPLKAMTVALLAAVIGGVSMQHLGLHDWMDMHGRMRGMMMGTPPTVPAAASAALGRFRCMACHALRERSVGPAFAWMGLTPSRRAGRARTDSHVH